MHKDRILRIKFQSNSSRSLAFQYDQLRILHRTEQHLKHRNLLQILLQNHHVVGVCHRLQRPGHTAGPAGKVGVGQFADLVVDGQPYVQCCKRVVMCDVVFDGLQAFPVLRLAQYLQKRVHFLAINI